MRMMTLFGALPWCGTNRAMRSGTKPRLRSISLSLLYQANLHLHQAMLRMVLTRSGVYSTETPCCTASASSRGAPASGWCHGPLHQQLSWTLLVASPVHATAFDWLVVVAILVLPVGPLLPGGQGVLGVASGYTCAARGAAQASGQGVLGIATALTCLLVAN